MDRLSDADLGFALGDDVAGLGARHKDRPGLQLVGESELVDDVRKIDAAGAALGWIRIDDGLGCEQRTFQRVD